MNISSFIDTQDERRRALENILKAEDILEDIHEKRLSVESPSESKISSVVSRPEIEAKADPVPKKDKRQIPKWELLEAIQEGTNFTLDPTILQMRQKLQGADLLSLESMHTRD